MHQQMYVSCSRFTNPFWYGCNSSIVWKPILVCYGLFQYDLDGGGRVKWSDGVRWRSRGRRRVENGWVGGGGWRGVFGRRKEKEEWM